MISNRNKKLKIICSLVILLAIAVMPLVGIGDLSAQADELLRARAAPTGPEEEYVPDQIIVNFKHGALSAAMQQLNQTLGTEVIYTSPFAGFKVLQIPKGKTVAEMVDIYSEQSIVEYAEPNYIRRASWSPNDPFYSYQWHFDQIDLESAWDLDTTAPNYGGDPSIIVAVLDSGVAYEIYSSYVQAPDLASTTFTSGYDFVNNDAHPNDDNNHGTHVCGTIAQSTNNGEGVAGIAFNTAIMPVKVLDDEGSGTIQQGADGIYYATDNGAKIINMSFGAPVTNNTERDAVAYAYNHGVTIICAAGNDYETGNDPEYPAAYDDYCIAVGATRYDQAHAPYSNTGSYLDIAAPGGDLSVDQNGDGYVDGILQQTFAESDPTDFGYYFEGGTSMACPHVAGVAALILAKHPSFTPDQVRQALESTATDLGDAGRDDVYGWGLLNAPAAVSWTSGQPDISISPTSFDETLAPDTTQDYTLVIANDGDASLTYSISDRETTSGSSAAGGEDLLLKPASMLLEIPLEGGPVEPVHTADVGSGWQNIMTDGFESAFPGIWDVDRSPGYTDAYWGKDNYSHSGSYSAFCAKSGTAGVNPPDDYPNDMNAWMIYGPFSLADASDAELNFYYWLDSEYEYDYLNWMASVDGSMFYGPAWTGNSDGWVSKSFDLTDVYTLGNVCGQPQVWIAFIFTSDYMITDKGAFIDDVVLRKYVSAANNPPYTPSNPSPANHATSVSADADLSWTGGDPDPGDTVTYDVYFGTSASPPLVSNDQTGTTYNLGTLSYNTKYYWKIVTADNHGASATGPLWNFTTGSAPNHPPQLSNPSVQPTSGTPSTNFYYYVRYYDSDGDSPGVKRVYIDGTPYTMSLHSGTAFNGVYRCGPKNLSAGSHSYYFYFTDGKTGAARLPISGSYSGPTVSEANNPPKTPSNPSPANHATGVSITADLSWTGGDSDAGDTVIYDVYFGTGASPALVSNDQVGTTYDLGTLSYGTKYYWKIVATDNHAASTTGPVWDFTTGGAVEDCPWLSEEPTSGSVQPGNSDSITVTIDTTGLSEGNYSAEIVITNNDPDENPKIVPVTLHVTASNNPPQLSSGSVNPTSGTPSTNFYYYVNYYDSDGDNPSIKRVYIDGTPCTMGLQSGSASNGVYRCDPKNLSAGSHSYYFYFTDGKGGAARLPISGSYSGPTVSEANNPPKTPSNPSPANHATGVSITADLSWTGGDSDAGDTVIYDVYFGTGASPALVSNDQVGTTYDLGTLSYGTKYYWKIVASDSHAASTTGPVWDFTTTTTGPGPVPVPCQFAGTVTLDGAPCPGSTVEARVDATVVGTTVVTAESEYYMVIAQDFDTGLPAEGDTLNFYVDGNLGGTGTWNAGGIKTLDLAAVTTGEDNPDVATGLASLGDKLVVAYGYKASEGGWTWYNPSWPTGANTLTTLYVGRGYWIKVNEACNLVYGTNTYELDADWNLIAWLGW